MPKIKINYTADQLADIAQQKKARKIQNRIKRKELKNKINQSGWKPFTGQTLPKQASMHQSLYETEGHYIFKYGGTWFSNLTYYRGDNPETATEWIVVTDNGGSYKHGAEYMLWYPNGSQALWSGTSLRKSIKSILSQGVVVKDPDYQT